MSSASDSLDVDRWTTSDAEHLYPFFEDEEGNGFFGLGHQDLDAFGEEVARFLEWNGCDLDGPVGKPAHMWASLSNDDRFLFSPKPGDGYDTAITVVEW